MKIYNEQVKIQADIKRREEIGRKEVINTERKKKTIKKGITEVKNMHFREKSHGSISLSPLRIFQHYC